MEALCQCAKFAQSFQRNIRSLFPLGLLCFYSSLNVFNFSATTKNLRTNDTFFITSKCFLLIGKIRTQRQMPEADFYYIRQMVTSMNPLYSKTYTRDVFRTQSSIYNKAFCNFCKKAPS